MANKISFCLTYYNQEKFVSQSIESVLAIDCPIEREILIGDDGSNDNTLNEIQKYKEKYPDIIKVFQMPREENKKYNPIHRAAANRLNLVKYSTGDYIMFLDGDDFYCSRDFLQKALDIFSTKKDLAICAFNFQYSKNGEIEPFRSKMTQGFLNVAKYIKKVYYTPAGACVFKNIFKNHIDLLSGTNNFDDNVITIFALQFGKFYFTNEIIYNYTQNDNSIWNTASKEEQHLLNAMDYRIISSIVPKFKRLVLKRQWSSLKSIYKQRKNLKEKLDSELHQKYLTETKENSDFILYTILNWDKSNLFQKLTISLWYKINKLTIKF